MFTDKEVHLLLISIFRPPPASNWKAVWLNLLDQVEKRGDETDDWLYQLNDTEKRCLLQIVDIDPSTAILSSMPYKEYLKTAHWERVRKEAIERANGRCAICNTDGPLQGHHRTYENRGDEKPGDVIALCRDCHKKFHGVEDD